MKARVKENLEGVAIRLMDINELRAYTNLGRNKAMAFGVDAGAKVQIGRRVLYDRQRIDDYIELLIVKQKPNIKNGLEDYTDGLGEKCHC